MVAMTFPVFADLSIVPLPLAPVIGIHSAVGHGVAVAVAARGAIFYVETARSNRE